MLFTLFWVHYGAAVSSSLSHMMGLLNRNGVCLHLPLTADSCQAYFCRWGKAFKSCEVSLAEWLKVPPVWKNETCERGSRCFSPAEAQTPANLIISVLFLPQYWLLQPAWSLTLHQIPPDSIILALWWRKTRRQVYPSTCSSLCVRQYVDHLSLIKPSDYFNQQGFSPLTGNISISAGSGVEDLINITNQWRKQSKFPFWN